MIPLISLTLKCLHKGIAASKQEFLWEMIADCMID